MCALFWRCRKVAASHDRRIDRWLAVLVRCEAPTRRYTDRVQAALHSSEVHDEYVIELPWCPVLTDAYPAAESFCPSQQGMMIVTGLSCIRSQLQPLTRTSLLTGPTRALPSSNRTDHGLPRRSRINQDYLARAIARRCRLAHRSCSRWRWTARED